MNMKWKKTETPLNLIQILPTEREKSKEQISRENAPHLRLQVGDSMPTMSIELFSKVTKSLSGSVQRIFESFKKCASFCHHGCVGTMAYIVASMSDLLVGAKKTGVWCAGSLAGASHGAQRYSRKILHSLKKSKSTSSTPVAFIPPAIESNVSESTANTSSSIATATKLETDELLWEVHALRDQLTAQKSELTRVTVQIGELKALALSQQQVLLHLGKEIESIEPKSMRSEKTTPKKAKARVSKSAKTKQQPSSSSPTAEASIRLDSHL
ncbi:MAG: hypothetical protein ACPGYT_05395 [Nitrospirales bacterium]